MSGRVAREGRPFRPTSPHPPAPPSGEDPARLVALLEAVNAGDSAELFRRTVEKDLSELIARSRRLRADLALTPEVANSVLTEALTGFLRPVGEARGR